MATKTEICNLALSHLGVSNEIANVETEQSEEARTCRRFYATIRDATLRDFHWPFASKVAALALIEEDPTTEWSYSYAYPTDCLDIRKILSGTRNDTAQTTIPYRFAYGDAGTEIYTDLEDAYIEYTVRVEDTGRFTPDFIIAFSFRLAAFMAARLAGGDPFKLGDKAAQNYKLEIAKAQASSLNEEQPDIKPDSEFITARN